MEQFNESNASSTPREPELNPAPNAAGPAPQSSPGPDAAYTPAPWETHPQGAPPSAPPEAAPAFHSGAEAQQVFRGGGRPENAFKPGPGPQYQYNAGGQQTPPYQHSQSYQPYPQGTPQGTQPTSHPGGTSYYSAPNQPYRKPTHAIPPEKTDALAFASLLCGVVSLVLSFLGLLLWIVAIGVLLLFLGILIGIAAVVTGILAMKRFPKGVGQDKNRTFVMAGLICGGVGLGLNLLFMVSCSALTGSVIAKFLNYY